MMSYFGRSRRAQASPTSRRSAVTDPGAQNMGMGPAPGQQGLASRTLGQRRTVLVDIVSAVAMAGEHSWMLMMI
jgi:hypothetical protein